MNTFQWCVFLALILHVYYFDACSNVLVSYIMHTLAFSLCIIIIMNNLLKRSLAILLISNQEQEATCANLLAKLVHYKLLTMY